MPIRRGRQSARWDAGGKPLVRVCWGFANETRRGVRRRCGDADAGACGPGRWTWAKARWWAGSKGVSHTAHLQT